MSVEVSVICDYCGVLMAAGKTAAKARRDARGSHFRAVRTAGEDLCGWCYDAKRKDAQRSAEGASKGDDHAG